MKERAGLRRAVNVGDYVILSTGAIARSQCDYPEGYDGPMDLFLDDEPMTELASTVMLPEHRAREEQSEKPEAVFESPAGEVGNTREGSRRMKD